MNFNQKITCFLALFLVAFQGVKSQVSLKNFPQDRVMVVAHRADWRQAPENSIWAIRKAIQKGVDMVEIDLSMSKDSVLILMHDKTLDRTTTGKGKPGDYTLQELRSFFLRDGLGVKTQMKIPTLEEVLDETQGKILVNLDKGFQYIDKVYPLLKKRNMLDQVLFKGNEPYAEFNRKYGNIKNEIFYMPIIRISGSENQKDINEFIENYSVYGFEVIVGMNQENMIDFKKLRDQNFRIWVNALWPEHNAGHHDDLSLQNPDVYQWYIDKKVNIIQTDRPQELIQFLRKKGLKAEKSDVIHSCKKK